MMSNYYMYPTDNVRLCKKDVCIEARGQNGQILVAAAVIVLLSAAAYYLSKVK